MKKLLALISAVLLVATFSTPAQSAGAKYTVYQKTLSPFSSTATTLTSQQKAQVKAAVEANPAAEKFICTGIRYFSQPMSENIKVRKRAKAACEYAKQLNPNLSTWFQNKPTQARSYAGKVLLTIKNPAPEEVASPFSVEPCKIPDGRPVDQQTLRPGNKYLGSYGMSNVGFPLSPDLFPVTGEVNFIVVPVSFSDLPGDPENIGEYLKQQTDKMTEWSEFWSQGKARYTFQVLENWQQLPNTQEEFTVADRSRGERSVDIQVGLANAIAKQVGNQVDWNKTYGIFAHFPLGFTAFQDEWGGRGDMVMTPAGEKQLFFRGGGVFHLTDRTGLAYEAKRELLWSYWIHEILHSQGSHLHAPGNGWPVGLDRNQYSGGGRNESGGRKFSGSLNSWEAFKMGWIEDDQVYCVDAREEFDTLSTELTAIELASSEEKIAVIRTGEYEGLLVESRRPVGYSATWASSDRGIMVYTINTTVMNDRTGEGNGDCGNNPDYPKFAFYLEPDQRPQPKNSCQFEGFILKPGESVTHKGVKIGLTVSSSTQDFILIQQVGITRSASAGSLNQPEQDGLIGELELDLFSREPEDNKFCGCCGCFPGANLH